MTLDEEKELARKAAFARRKQAFDAGHPAQSALLSEVLAEHRGKVLAGYMPIRTEIDPRHAMAEAAAFGPVAVPVIRAAGQPLVFSQWTPDCTLVDGPFGARVPETERLLVPEVLIVPLVAFNRNGGRLGYGGGFYDRSLERLRARGTVLAIGFAWSAQETENLPLEPTDQPLDLIVTERAVIDLRA